MRDNYVFNNIIIILNMIISILVFRFKFPLIRMQILEKSHDSHYWSQAIIAIMQKHFLPQHESTGPEVLLRSVHKVED